MKHIFVINPHAGPHDATSDLTQKIQSLTDTIEYEIYVTRCHGDAIDYVRRRCHGMDETRFYACGGDGTLNEVATGILLAQDHDGQHCPPPELACIPCGSGNDYVKYYPGDYDNLSNLVDGTPHKIDIMRIGDRCCVNVCNFGFDAIACKNMAAVKRKPIIGGHNAYTTGVVKALFSGFRNHCRLSIGGHLMHDGDMLLCTLSNGRYVGGAYQCAPRSINDDGLLEVLLFKSIALHNFLAMVSAYKNGRHFDQPRFAKFMKYDRAAVVDVESDHPFDLCIDGEMLEGTHFHIENQRQRITFIAPRQ